MKKITSTIKKLLKITEEESKTKFNYNLSSIEYKKINKEKYEEVFSKKHEINQNISNIR